MKKNFSSSKSRRHYHQWFESNEDTSGEVKTYQLSPSELENRKNKTNHKKAGCEKMEIKAFISPNKEIIIAEDIDSAKNLYFQKGINDVSEDKEFKVKEINKDDVHIFYPFDKLSSGDSPLSEEIYSRESKIFRNHPHVKLTLKEVLDKENREGTYVVSSSFKPSTDKKLIDHIRDESHCNYVDILEYLTEINQCSPELKAKYLSDLVWHIHTEENKIYNVYQN